MPFRPNIRKAKKLIMIKQNTDRWIAQIDEGSRDQKE